MKIYISGRITGYSLFHALKKFAQTERYLREHGYDSVVNPTTLHDYSIEQSWKDYMIVDIKHLFDCDAIFMQSDWSMSKGARIEYQIAKELGLKIIFEEEVPF